MTAKAATVENEQALAYKPLQRARSARTGGNGGRGSTTNPTAVGLGDRSLTITVALPDRALCGNGRAHGFARSRLVAAQREQATLAAYAAMGTRSEALRAPLFPGGRVQATITVYRDPLWSARRLDDDNLIRGLKGVWDSFQQAGVYANDRQVAIGVITWITAKPMQGKVEITLREAA